ncbi:L-threonylcarbamoyladenylate synthase [Rubrivirga sp. S365]|uniref:Threonylcarbamoyl-AMP synthase n=1 Tax=Rubrivirga litoralis TaxID=3075598 RepID=A0ABU3BUL9_9BACT|nr:MULTISPECIES: L-threonylcarbamoyladenylate synthase [unclassified Rubrivirga]MDT0632986.1 L-threonylcarbamoyladenylate synthase [Rubrivirga sp. F394]MDT7857886.1 L-threonylcarbamoyladenylate synthase [Rubrivirga sp. S365]
MTALPSRLVPPLLTDSPAEAAAVLRRGGLVAFPTETVYGLGALARDADAVARVFAAKGRPADNPLIVHVARVADVAGVALVTPLGAALLEAFAPGPLSVVLPGRGGLPDAVTAGLDTVAVRVPGHRPARALLEAAGAPVVAPSANRSGRPSPTTWRAVVDDLGGRVDAVLRGPLADVGLESTVVDATGEAPVVLRPGAVSFEALRERFPDTSLLAERGGAVRSPGLRHRHYAPRARVRLANVPPERGDAEAAWIGLAAPPPGYGLVEVCPDVETYARRLFDLFRRADAAGLASIDAERVPETGLGRALMDRLRRAAEG